MTSRNIRKMTWQWPRRENSGPCHIRRHGRLLAVERRGALRQRQGYLALATLAQDRGEIQVVYAKSLCVLRNFQQGPPGPKGPFRPERDPSGPEGPPGNLAGQTRMLQKRHGFFPRWREIPFRTRTAWCGRAQVEGQTRVTP